MSLLSRIMQENQSFDPLAAQENLGPAIVAAVTKRKIHNIIDSYHGWYDPFSELIQNALDAIDERIKSREEEYDPHLWITINLRENSLSVTENGIGFTKEEFESFLAPEMTFKLGKDLRGNKGVGSTYIAYGYNFLQIGTKKGKYSFIGNIKNARDWVEDKENIKTNPNVEPDDVIDPHFNEITQGSTFTLRFIGTHIRPKDLRYTMATTAEQWEAILKIKTPLGGIYLSRPRPHVTCSIEVIDENGIPTQKILEDLEYSYPHKIIKSTKTLKEIEEKRQELTDRGNYTGRLPSMFYSLNGLYQIWNTQEILESKWGFRLELSPEERGRIQEYNIHLYAFQGYSTKLWKNYSDSILNLRKGYKIIWGGLQLATNLMPQGEIETIALTKTTGLTSTTHVVIHLDGATPDYGRKGFPPEIKSLTQKLAAAAVHVLRANKNFMKSESANPRDPEAERDLHDWIQEQESHAREKPLSINRSDLFLPTREISITSEPCNEQDTIALFNQLLAGGVIRSIKLLATHQTKTYDGLFRFVVKAPQENHIFNLNTNPLGIENDRFKELETVSKVIEYKFNLDDLIEEFSKGDKDQADINLVVVWEMGGKWRRAYNCISLLDLDNIQHREYQGITHNMTQQASNYFAFYIISLKELVAFINDPTSVQGYQKDTYLEE